MNLLHGLSVSVVDPYWIRIGSVFRSFLDPDPYSEYNCFKENYFSLKLF